MKDFPADKYRFQEKTTLTEKNFIDSLFAFYTQNSFGAVSKRELDIFLFNQFQRLGKIHSTDSWEIAKELKISQTKARTLLYESSLRNTKEAAEEEALIRESLKSSPQIKAENKISLTIDNRYARDAIRSYLREKGFFSDTSFASDVITMPTEAYIDLLERFYPEIAKKISRDELLQTFANVGCGMLSQIIGEKASDGLENLFLKAIKWAKSKNQNFGGK